jgi:hypothetical protein
MLIQKVDNATRFTFFEDRDVIAILEATAVTEELLDIAVSSAGKQGRLLCKVVNNDISFVAYENLSFVLQWIKQCKGYLRIPL